VPLAAILRMKRSPKIRVNPQAIPAPRELPMVDSTPPQKPPNTIPPGAYSMAPGRGATTTSTVTNATYAAGAAGPRSRKKARSVVNFSAAEYSDESSVAANPPLAYDQPTPINNSRAKAKTHQRALFTVAFKAGPRF